MLFKVEWNHDGLTHFSHNLDHADAVGMADLLAECPDTTDVYVIVILAE
jgi:hypothetical protein